jgi:hypothetical protein
MILYFLQYINYLRMLPRTAQYNHAGRRLDTYFLKEPLGLQSLSPNPLAQLVRLRVSIRKQAGGISAGKQTFLTDEFCSFPHFFQGNVKTDRAPFVTNPYPIQYPLTTVPLDATVPQPPAPSINIPRINMIKLKTRQFPLQLSPKKGWYCSRPTVSPLAPRPYRKQANADNTNAGQKN